MPTNAPPDARPPVKLAHFVVRTPHYDETVAWYQAVLGATVVFSNAMLSFLTYDDEHHRVAVINVLGLGESADPLAGIDHVAFAFSTLDDLLYTYRRLKCADIVPYWCINHGPTTSLYYRDPNGIQVELQIDNFASAEELNAWVRSGEFKRNPIGVEFDPDVLCQRFDRGDPVSELVQQGATSR